VRDEVQAVVVLREVYDCLRDLLGVETRDRSAGLTAVS
jgi:hypothetical protein